MGAILKNQKNVVLMDIINSLLKTGNKTANINKKLQRKTAADEKPNRINHKKVMLTTLILTFRRS